MNLLSRIQLSLILLTGLVVGSQAQQPDVSKREFKLVKIHFEGLVNQPEQKIIGLSGLQIGQTVTMEILNQASQRLIDTGSFSSVKFRYKYRGDDLEATFVVIEARGSILCVFDNFMWFSDEEIHTAIRQDVPGFDGKATEGGEMIDAIRKSLEKLLRTKSATGNIEHEMANLGDLHVFKIVGVPMPICSIEYAGLGAFSSAQLTTAAKELLSSDYSRLMNGLVLRDAFIPLYRQNGYLKFRLLPVKATLEKAATEKCKNGAALLISLNEGTIYQWQGITWAGNQILTSEKLARSFTLKTGEIADGLKIDRGFALASHSYQDKGYFAAEVKPVPTFDESAKTVSFAVTIIEGEQYSFGQLAVKGLNESVTKNFLERWQTLHGKPFDAITMQSFVKKTISENTMQIKLSLTPSPTLTPNHESRSVDLLLEF